MNDPASEYGRLLAARDRLIADGADPDDVLIPLPPFDPRAYPDPLTVEPALVRLRAQSRPRGCSVFPFLVAATFWVVLYLVLAALGPLP